MRIWDIPCHKLCRKHLLGEHRELHAIWSILTNRKKGYANHPEVRRWRGHLWALYLRHAEQVFEMLRRGYQHRSNLPFLGLRRLGKEAFPKPITPIMEQYRLLARKHMRKEP